VPEFADESEGRASELPHREKYLLLVNDFLRSFLDLHEQLIDGRARAHAKAATDDLKRSYRPLQASLGKVAANVGTLPTGVIGVGIEARSATSRRCRAKARPAGIGASRGIGLGTGPLDDDDVLERAYLSFVVGVVWPG
jgi:hypothetical protein